MKKKKTIVIIMILFLCSSVVIAYATINSSIVVNNRENPYTDVSARDWFYEDIQYVYENKLMNGTSDSEFSPQTSATRGMVVTILWRLEGEPIEDGKFFEDVSNDTYYYKAVAWASNNIVSGYGEKIFAPDDTVTREQLATIMHRYASYKKYDLSKKAELDRYDDKEQISEYAIESIEWANANGIILGTSETTISPKDNVSRLQVAAILRRFCENFKILESDTENESQYEEERNGNDKVEEDTTVNGDDSLKGTTNNSTDETPGSSSGNDSSDFEIPPDPDEEIADIIGAKSATIKLKTTYGKAGDTIPVVVELRENPGIIGAILSLEYDESAMTLVDVENGEAVADVLTLTHSKEFASGMNFVWDGLELDSNDIKEGELLVLYFELSPDAIPGKRYPLKLTHKPGSVVDADLNKVNLIISQGFVEIEE